MHGRYMGGAREVHGRCMGVHGCAWVHGWGWVGVDGVAAWGVLAGPPGVVSVCKRRRRSARVERYGDYSFGVQALSSAEQASLAC